MIDVELNLDFSLVFLSLTFRALIDLYLMVIFYIISYVSLYSFKILFFLPYSQIKQIKTHLKKTGITYDRDEIILILVKNLVLNKV